MTKDAAIAWRDRLVKEIETVFPAERLSFMRSSLEAMDRKDCLDFFEGKQWTDARPADCWSLINCILYVEPDTKAMIFPAYLRAWVSTVFADQNTFLEIDMQIFDYGWLYPDAYPLGSFSRVQRLVVARSICFVLLAATFPDWVGGEYVPDVGAEDGISEEEAALDIVMLWAQDEGKSPT